MPVHAKALEKQAVSYFSDLGQGFTYIKNHAYIKHFFIFCAVFMVLAAPAAFLTPLQVTRSFGNDVWRLTAIEISFPIFNVPSTVLLQEKVEGDYLGRVFGVLSMISSVMMPVAMLVFGPLADIVRIELLLIVTGILLFIQAFFLIGNKVLVEAGKPDQVQISV